MMVDFFYFKGSLMTASLSKMPIIKNRELIVKSKIKIKIVKAALYSALVSATSWAMAAEDHQQSSDSMQKFYVGANIGYLHAPWKDAANVEIPGVISF